MSSNNNVLVYARDFDSNKFNGLKLVNDKIELNNDVLSGSYESKEYELSEFTCAVASYACVTDKTRTCEIEVSVKVNNKWSKYFTYGEFGLGRTNLYYDQDDVDSYIDTDMIMMKNSLYANGVKFKVTLRRNTLDDLSPSLSLVNIALFMKEYKCDIDSSRLPTSVDYDVPKLYQHDVPVIGNQICSATTTTMLLKFYGFDFKDKGYKFEHEYMANMVADTAHNNPTYGNWSYNMMAAGAYGVNACFKVLSGLDELKYYLATTGPVGISIRGEFGIYKTGGHLLVLRGYREEDNQTTFICNDPNVKGTYYEVKEDIFTKAWRKAIYFMEFTKDTLESKRIK